MIFKFRGEGGGYLDIFLIIEGENKLGIIGCCCMYGTN